MYPFLTCKSCSVLWTALTFCLFVARFLIHSWKPYLPQWMLTLGLTHVELCIFIWITLIIANRHTIAVTERDVDVVDFMGFRTRRCSSSYCSSIAYSTRMNKPKLAVTFRAIYCTGATPEKLRWKYPGTFDSRLAVKTFPCKMCSRTDYCNPREWQ